MSLRALIFGFLTFSLLTGYVFGDEIPRGFNDRHSRFFDWRDLRSGLEQAFDDVQETVDTFGKNLGDILTSKVESRRNDPVMLSDEPMKIDAIEGSFGGVDDGLKVFFPNKQRPSIVRPGDHNGFHFGFSSGPEKSPSLPGSSYRPFQGPFMNPFKDIFGDNFFSIGRSKPWWSRENVCVEREEIQESEAPAVEVKSSPAETSNGSPLKFFGSFEASSCSENGREYSCVTETKREGVHKTFKTTYQCCHGYVRNDNVCTKIDLHPMMKTLEGLPSATNFVSLLKSTGIEELVSNSNLTIFVPTDEALEEFTVNLLEKNEIPLRSSSDDKSDADVDFKEIVKSHLTKGFIFDNDFEDEKLIPSLNSETSVRINIYSGYPRIVTANCAPVIQPNVHSTNGVVHAIGQVLPSAKATLSQIIDKDPQFSILKQLLANSDLESTLRQPGQWTLLAPTDAAFNRLNASTLESLLNGGTCVNAVLENHLLPNTICSAAIQGRKKTSNQAGDFLIVHRDEDDKLFVQDAQIVAKDIVATNGVLHILDKVIIPDHAKPMREILEYHNLTRFLELLEEADLMNELESGNKVNVFAPTNEAIQNYPVEEMQLLRNDKEKLRELLRHHMVKGSPIDSYPLQNNKVALSEAGLSLRFNIFSQRGLFDNLLNLRSRPTKVTVGCSRVSLMNSRACGGVVHVLEEVLRPPTGDVLGEINDAKFSIFRRMVSETKHEKTLSGQGPFTVFAPSDFALRSLPEDELQKIMNSPELREKIVERHILPELVCCSGVNSDLWHFMDRKRTTDGSTLHVRKTAYDQLMAGPARIVECGKAAENGVVHTVDRLTLSHRELAMLLSGKKPSNQPQTFQEWANLFA